MKRLKKNNAGFSLIEMVVAVLVASLLMLGVAAFVSTSRYTYSKVSTDARLQEEATAATNFLNELLIESKLCGSGSVITTAGKNLEYIWVRANQSEIVGGVTSKNLYTYFIIFEKPAAGETTGVLRFKKAPASDANLSFPLNAATGRYEVSITNETSYFNDVVGNKYHFLCRCVKDMTLSTVESNNGRLYKVNLTFNYNGQDFSATVNNLSRNIQEP